MNRVTVVGHWKAVTQSNTWPFAYWTVCAFNIVAPPIGDKKKAGGEGSYCLNSKEQKNFSIGFCGLQYQWYHK